MRGDTGIWGRITHFGDDSERSAASARQLVLRPRITPFGSMLLSAAPVNPQDVKRGVQGRAADRRSVPWNARLCFIGDWLTRPHREALQSALEGLKEVVIRVDADVQVMHHLSPPFDGAFR